MAIIDGFEDTPNSANVQITAPGVTANLRPEIIESCGDRAVTALRAMFDRVVLPALRSENTRRAYAREARTFFTYLVTEQKTFTRATVQDYLHMRRAADVSSASLNLSLATLKRIAKEAYYAGLVDIAVYQGVNDISGERKAGRRTGNWLTVEQVNKLLAAVDKAGEGYRNKLRAARDAAIVSILIGCGLRREELCSLTAERIQQRDGRWVFADLKGKGRKFRTVPIPNGVKARIDAWVTTAKKQAIHEGEELKHLFIPIHKSGGAWHINRREPMSSQTIFAIARRYGAMIGLPKLAPHDLRRTFARLVRKGGADLDQIQFSLGHASVQTTEKYIGANQNIEHAPGDVLAPMGIDWLAKIEYDKEV